MKPYILTERNGIYIIDLQQSLKGIENTYEFVKQTVAHNGSILFVGTKKQAQEIIEQQASRVDMPFVNHRWLGGMLTNFKTVAKRLQRLKELEHIDFDDVAGSGFTKKELLMKRREKDKLARTLGGIRNMAKLPSAVWVIDTNKEHLAVAEARKLNIPIIAVLDTNCDPDEVDYPIAGNDDAIRAVEVLTRLVADACADGIRERMNIKKKKEKSGEDSEEQNSETTDIADDEPIPAWQEELLRGEDPSQEKADSSTDDENAASDQTKDAADSTADDTAEDNAEAEKTSNDTDDAGDEQASNTESTSDSESAPAEEN